MIKLPHGLVVPEVPLEIRYTGVLKGLLTRIKHLYEAIYTRYGEEGLALIREISEEYGGEIARRARKNDEPWQIDRVGLYLIKIFNNMNADGEVTEFSEQRVSIMVPRCPYPFENEQICSAHTSMERALVTGLNPALDYRIEKCLPAGDKFCLHVVTFR